MVRTLLTICALLFTTGTAMANPVLSCAQTLQGYAAQADYDVRTVYAAQDGKGRLIQPRPGDLTFYLSSTPEKDPQGFSNMGLSLSFPAMHQKDFDTLNARFVQQGALLLLRLHMGNGSYGAILIVPGTTPAHKCWSSPVTNLQPEEVKDL